MDNFTDFISLYEHLEKEALNYRWTFQIGDLFQKLRDFLHEQNQEENSQIAQWEVDFFNFRTTEGNMIHSYGFSDMM